jgi:uncharacterized iron-regulated protein
MGSCAVAGKEKESGSLPVMTPIVVEPAKSATLPKLMTELRAERLIYVGETHTAYADHLLQLEVLRAMAARPEGLVIGVEWFQRPFQAALDDYLAGRIDEAEMLRRTEYYDRWRFDYRLYRPIIQFAKDKGIPIIALNASRELTDEIRRVGINELPEDQRAELPDSYDFGDKAYEAILRDMFDRHQAEGRVFQRFLEVQLTWDESMAQGVADYLETSPAGRILVLAGRGHIAGRSGIPNRVTRRTGLKGVVIATFAPSGQHFNEADYLILATEQSLPAAGLMRVLLDEREGGVYIQGFTSDSPAEAAGVEKDDRILSINGEPIEHFADVKIALLEQQPGDEIALKLQRDRLLGGEQTIDLKIKLAGESAFRHP